MSINALLDEFKVKLPLQNSSLLNIKLREESNRRSAVLRTGRACLCRRYGAHGNLGFQ